MDGSLSPFLNSPVLILLRRSSAACRNGGRGSLGSIFTRQD